MADQDFSDLPDSVKDVPVKDIFDDDGNTIGMVFIDEAKLKVPDTILSQADSLARGGSLINRRFKVWSIIDGWKQANAEQAYGPVRERTLYFMEDSGTFEYPNGFVYYSNQAIPSGVQVSIAPDRLVQAISGSISPALPDGLTFNASTFTIEGSAMGTSPRTRYLVRSVGNTGSFRTSFFLEVYDPLVCENYIEYNSRYVVPTGSVATISPNEWIVQQGSIPTVNPSLPAGLTFTSATGVISGTPTEVTPARVYRVRALGAGPCSGDTFGDAFSLAVCAVGYPSAVYSVQTTSIPISVARTITPTVYANVGAATISPTLPTGMSFTSATGVISGTPSVATQHTVYTIAYSGAAPFQSITDSTSVSFNVCSVSQPTPSAIHWEVIPITTSASDWDATDQNFLADYRIVDHRVSPPSAVTMSFGKNVARHPLIWIFQRSLPYQCNILLRRGSYPSFRFKKGNTWLDAWTTSGIRGVRLIAEQKGEVVKFQMVTNIALASFSSVGSVITNRSGIMRDIQFSGIYFSGVDAPGNNAFVIGNGNDNSWVPGLHFYDCIFDAKRRTVKWIMRTYGAHDLRLIRCVFKDNWTFAGPGAYPNTPTEHAFYNNADVGNNYILSCTFSGISRNAVQLGSYKTYYGLPPFNVNIQPRCSGAWVIRDTSAIECGLGSWGINQQGQLDYIKNNNGSVFYTIAGTSAVWMQNCHASGGFHGYYGSSTGESTGALVVWKNPATVGFEAAMTQDPQFYGNKIIVLSSCQFHMNWCPEFDMVNLKNIRQLWVSGGVFNYRGARSLFALSGRSSSNAEEQGINPSGLPFIASSFFNFPLTSATFPQGYPPSVKANCVNLTNCDLLSQTQFEALVNAADQPPPTPPAIPAEGAFLFQNGYTFPVTGVTVP
jgi:hypothetical protein